MPVIDVPIPSSAIRPLPAKLANQAQGPVEEIAKLDIAEPSPAAETPGDSFSFDSSDVSTLLSLALLQGLASLTASAFPMPASLLYSAHVLPNRPAYIPAAKREEVVIAKSSWKKLSKWMKEAAKDGLIKIKEAKDGGVTVNSFDAKHPSLVNHDSFVTVAQEEMRDAKKKAREAAEGDVQTKAGEFTIEEFWKPSGPAISFWEACGAE